MTSHIANKAMSPCLFQGLQIRFVQQHFTFKGWRGELQSKALGWLSVILEQINLRFGSLCVGY